MKTNITIAQINWTQKEGSNTIDRVSNPVEQFTTTSSEVPQTKMQTKV